MEHKIVCISDTHTKHHELTTDLPKGGILIHSGDIMGSGYTIYEAEDFANWCKMLLENGKYAHIVLIAGKHDRAFEMPAHKQECIDIIKNAGIIYLEDSGITLEGLKIWGSPVQPEFCSWAFNRARTKEDERFDFIGDHWDLIPDNIDILITHGPPRGILDRCIRGSHEGCDILLEVVKRVKPKLHVFGHIHEDNGRIEKDGTIFVNASSLNLYYMYTNKPIVVELEK